MRAWKRAGATLLVALLIVPADAAADGRDRSDWQRVQALKSGARVAVHLQDGETIKGTFVSADGDGVSVKDGKIVRVISRSDVREVRKGRRSPLRKVAGFILGAVIGMVAGAFLGSALDTCDACEDPGLLGFVYGFFVGAIAGAILGVVIASKGEGAVIYRLDPRAAR